MNNTILKMVISVLLPLLKPQIIKDGLDAFFDVVENAVARSENKIDDIVVLPIIKIMRNTLNVPDNDENENITK